LDDVFIHTPAPPPFSSMNSTPADGGNRAWHPRQALEIRRLIEHDGEDAITRFSTGKLRLGRLLRDTEDGILFNEYFSGDGPTVFPTCLPAWRRGDRLQAGGRDLSIASVPGRDQALQSRERHSAAGA
jgi:hypothetical protein